METNELKDLGLVSDYVGKKGKIGIVDSNLAGSARVIINLLNDKKEKLRCFLGTGLSKQLRDKEITLGTLLTLRYAENERGHIYIVRPQGNEIYYEAKELTVEDYQSEEVNIEDFLTL
jgi:hypothetical protein